MLRKIIHIDEDKCNGCGLCAKACHEGAIKIVDGKARLMREDYCDGLGDCLPTCPTAAISFVEREAKAYDKEAVLKKASHESSVTGDPNVPKAPLPCGCPGSLSRAITHDAPKDVPVGDGTTSSCSTFSASNYSAPSLLSNWPVQLKLAPTKAPYFEGAHLLIAADCTAYALGAFHESFIKNHITLIGCPKLDDFDYSEKLTAIIADNDILDVTIVRMEVPCCASLAEMAKKALIDSGKFIPWSIHIISTDGEILE